MSDKFIKIRNDEYEKYTQIDKKKKTLDIIKSKNIYYGDYLKKLASQLGQNYDKNFREIIFNVFFSGTGEKFKDSTKEFSESEIVEQRTKVLHEVIFLKEIKKDLTKIKDAFNISKERIINYTKHKNLEIEKDYIRRAGDYYIKKGGNFIKTQKEKINKLGLYGKFKVNVEVPDDFIKAVMKFQKDNNLFIDGKIGDETTKVLDKKLELILNRKKQEEIITKDEFKKIENIKKTNENILTQKILNFYKSKEKVNKNYVSDCKAKLNILGFGDFKNDNEVTIDFIKAVKLYQRIKGFSKKYIDGMVGIKTNEKINTDLNEILKNKKEDRKVIDNIPIIEILKDELIDKTLKEKSKTEKKEDFENRIVLDKDTNLSTNLISREIENFEIDGKFPNLDRDIVPLKYIVRNGNAMCSLTTRKWIQNNAFLEKDDKVLIGDAKKLYKELKKLRGKGNIEFFKNDGKVRQYIENLTNDLLTRYAFSKDIYKEAIFDFYINTTNGHRALVILGITNKDNIPNLYVFDPYYIKGEKQYMKIEDYLNLPAIKNKGMIIVKDGYRLKFKKS